MIDIEISSTPHGWDATVEVDAGTHHASRHNVRVTHRDMERWGHGGEPEDLVRRSFEFLLEREPAKDIKKSFELADIERYFPEFGKEMGK